MDEKHVPGGLGQDRLQERLGTCRGQAALDALRAQAPRERLHGPPHLVPFALATGVALGLLAAAGPRRARGAPWGTTGFHPHTRSGLDNVWQRVASWATCR